MEFKQIEPHWHVKGGVKLLIYILDYESLQIKRFSSMLLHFICELKLQKSVKSHDKLLRIKEFRQLNKIYRAELLVQLVHFDSSTHVADNIGNSPWIGLIRGRKIVLPVFFDAVNDFLC